MNISRVVDRQAIVDAPTLEGTISIANKIYMRRLISAPALVTLVQECRSSIARDSWETEGDLSNVIPGWVGVFVWSGDKKCSSATYWNTGNPRPLAESHAWVPAGGTPPESEALYEFLANRYRRAVYHDRSQPSSPWFEGPADAVARDVERFLANPSSAPKPGRHRHDPGEAMVYLMQESGTEWIKIGKCGASTSPPAKRRSMYQPGNPREIVPAAAWTFEGINPERRMQAALRKETQRRGSATRAEWFEIGATDALTILARQVFDCTAVPADRLGR